MGEAAAKVKWNCRREMFRRRSCGLIPVKEAGRYWQLVLMLASDTDSARIKRMVAPGAGRHIPTAPTRRIRMKLITLLALLGLALGTACTDTRHYPISGEECSPQDPVKDLSVQQCANLN